MNKQNRIWIYLSAVLIAVMFLSFLNPINDALAAKEIEYTYTSTPLDDLGNIFYSNHSRVFILNTDRNGGDKRYISLVLKNPDGTPAESVSSGPLGVFDNLKNLPANSKLKSIAPKYPGNYKLRLVYTEYTSYNGSYYPTLQEVIHEWDIVCIDSSQAEKDWFQSLLDQYTDETMNPLEKLRAVNNHLCEIVKYLATYQNSHGRLTFFKSTYDYCTPRFLNEKLGFRTDSYLSPDLLFRLAK